MISKQNLQSTSLYVKKWSVFFVLFIGLMILSLNCTKAPSIQKLDPTTVEKELRSMETEHKAAVDSKDIDGIMKFYSKDLINIPPDGPIQHGNDWIPTFMADIYKTYDFHEEFNFIDIQIIEENVVASISFRQQMTKLTSGAQTVQTGKGMCLLKKSKAGNWQFVWNSYSYESSGSN